MSTCDRILVHHALTESGQYDCSMLMESLRPQPEYLLGHHVATAPYVSGSICTAYIHWQVSGQSLVHVHGCNIHLSLWTLVTLNEHADGTASCSVSSRRPKRRCKYWTFSNKRSWLGGSVML